jgi:hypothetical protein
MIPNVPVRGTIRASHQNLLIDQVNENTEAISTLQEGGGGLPPEEIQEMIDASVTAHVEADTPHPAYDTDIPSLSIIFQNGLV